MVIIRKAKEEKKATRKEILSKNLLDWIKKNIYARVNNI